MDGTRFRLNLSLQMHSTISTAIELWEAPEVKSQIRENFSKTGDQCVDNWIEIQKKVLRATNSMELPSSLLSKLQDVIVFVGEKIRDWIHYVTRTLDLEFVFAEKIYWTSHGGVDESKIFDLYWRDLMSIENFKTDSKSKYLIHAPLFSLACIYGCERFVSEHKNEMLDEMIKVSQMRTGNDIVYDIMSAYICLATDKRSEDYVKRPRKMFELCLEQGFSKAAKYYWKKLDEAERVLNLTVFARKSLKEIPSDQSDEEVYGRESYCENLLFLVNQMGQEERQTFFSNFADKIIKTLFPVWPYRDLIWVFLDSEWSVDASKMSKLFKFVLVAKGSINVPENPFKNGLYFRIVQKAWNVISKDNDALERFIYSNETTMFLNFHVPTLNLILNDKIVQSEHSDMAELAIESGCVELVKRGCFHLVDELIVKVMSFDQKPKKYLKANYHDFVEGLIEKDEFERIDQFFDWVSDTEDERARLKNDLDCVSICQKLTERMGDFGLADKFLKWTFETDEEIKNFKEEIKSFQFVATAVDYVRISSGDLSELRPGDYLSYGGLRRNNPGGYKFRMQATTLNPGEVVGVKRSENLMGRDFRLGSTSFVSTSPVRFVGTGPGDYVFYNVCKIWNRNNKIDNFQNLQKVMNASDAFIKFYYETDEEVINFKKSALDRINTENLIEFLYNHFFKDHSYVRLGVLDAFFKFCLIPPDKIEDVKTQQRNNIEKLLGNYLIDQCDFGLADFCINWLYFSSEKREKTEIIKSILNLSNNGALLCVSYFKKMERYGNSFQQHVSSSSSDFQISHWLKMIDDMEKLKRDLYALHPDPPRWFIALLDELTYTDVMSAVNTIRRKFFGMGAGGII